MKKRTLSAVCAATALTAITGIAPMRSHGATARMATEIFVTNKVAVVSNYVNTVKAEMEERTPVKRIAMFIIPVNYETNGNFTGFELKASTNNFSHAAGTDDTRLQFYSQSEAADIGANYGNNWDKMKMYVGTGYGSSWDVRAYTRIGNTIDWGHKLRNVVVIVDASCVLKHPGDWLREDNEDLMWCYLRNMNNDVEYEEGTSKNLWHPIAPVRWFSELPNWAVQ